MGGRTAWGHQVWDTPERIFNRTFPNAPVPVNPVVAQILQEQAAEQLRQRQAAAAAARLWAERAAEAERKRLERMKEPEDMLAFDTVSDPFLPVLEAAS